MKKDPDVQSFFTDIKNILVDYLQNRYELARLSAYEKIAKITAVLFSGIILTMLFFFTVLFFSLMGGFYFGKVFHSMFYGFAIVASFYLLVFIVLFIFRKSLIDRFIINAVIQVLFEEDEEE